MEEIISKFTAKELKRSLELLQLIQQADEHQVLDTITTQVLVNTIMNALILSRELDIKLDSGLDAYKHSLN